MFIGRIKSNAIDINSFKEDIIENFLEDKAREKVLSIAEKLYKIDEKSDIKKAYIELKNILEEFRNILINYKKNDYNEIINIIEKYKEKAPILKNILSAVITMSERGKDDIKKRLYFLISESLKNVNYFLTRINIIIDRL